MSKENKMKISIITVCYNSEKTIESAIKSVLGQTHDIEYIIVDGGSTDGTVGIINKYRDRISKIISEPDKGIYDAMNKGIRAATGDVVGTLNSDDFYVDGFVVEKVVKKFEEKNVDCLWGDLVYVDRMNADKVVRVWKSSEYGTGKFKSGWYPPHPTFFVKRSVYEKYGLFNPDFKIAADIEIMLRFLEKLKISSAYIPEVLVKMRTGGVSARNLKNIIRANVEVYHAWKINGLKICPIWILLKPFSKLGQFVGRSR